MTAQNSHQTIKLVIATAMAAFSEKPWKGDRTINDALQAIEQIIKTDVIGEDTKGTLEDYAHNRLRDTQRTALTKALYGKERE